MKAAAIVGQNTGHMREGNVPTAFLSLRLLQSLVRMQAAAVVSQNAGCCSHGSECRSYLRRARTNSFPFLEAAAPVLLIGLLLEAIVLQQAVAGVLLGRGRRHRAAHAAAHWRR